ncbi:MAG: MBL fold metallo-hydrolase [Actinomycetota bacterium]
MGKVSIAFLGATATVTGSRFLVTSEKSSVLIDAGLFQGLREVRKLNWEPFPVEPSTIDAIVLTHAHLDHCGYIPLLVRNGFSKKIFSTSYTSKLATVILRDSAFLQMEDAKYAKEKGFSKHPIPLPLYDTEDVERTLAYFSPTNFRQKTQITEDASITFFPSGHILGAAFVLLEIDGRSLLFTGDMGRKSHPLLSSPDKPPQMVLDAIITESTYGDRVHETPSSAFAQEINKALKRGGSILIPAFAVDRTEVILMALRDLIDKGEIPKIPIYVDSPMALTALSFYREAVTNNSPEIREGVSERWRNADPFDSGTLVESRTVDESKALNEVKSQCIIISASGMATGGRVVHHLAHMLPDPHNTVILVGFQAAGSRGRSLEEGQREIKIHGKWVSVSAAVAKVESFSVHADAGELVDWLGSAKKPNVAFIVHGEHDAQVALAEKLQSQLNWNAIIPKSGQVFELT